MYVLLCMYFYVCTSMYVLLLCQDLINRKCLLASVVRKKVAMAITFSCKHNESVNRA